MMMNQQLAVLYNHERPVSAVAGLQRTCRIGLVFSLTILLLTVKVISSTKLGDEYRHDFIEQMRIIAEKHQSNEEEMPLSLQQRLIAVAKRITTSEHDDASSQNHHEFGKQVIGEPNNNDRGSTASHRRLNNYYNAYYNAKNKYINSYYNSNNKQGEENVSENSTDSSNGTNDTSSSSSTSGDETSTSSSNYYSAGKDSFYDDYFAFLDDDDYKSQGQYKKAESYNIDLTQLAMKYIGCQNIHSWEDGSLLTSRFVVFRLCDASSCSSYNKWGCYSEYGQYMLPLETYLKVMAEYYYQDFNKYCSVCYDCMRFKDDDSDSTYECVVDEEALAASQTNTDDYLQNGDDYYHKTDDSTSSSSSSSSASSSSSSSSSSASSSSSSSSTAVGYNQYNSWYYNNNNNNNNAKSNDGASYNYKYYGYNANKNTYQNTNYGYNRNGNRVLGNNNNKNSTNSSCADGYIRQKKAYPWYITSDGQCSFSTVCQRYKKTCKAHQQNASDYEDFFSCSAFTVGNTKRYLGPHCRSDGHTIGIGIYSDNKCNNFVGDSVDISAYTGQIFDDTLLQNYYDKSCIACNYDQSYALINDTELGKTQNINQMCEALFDVSAKCNQYLTDASEGSSDEDTVCQFIDSAMKNKYDDNGDLVSTSSFVDVQELTTPQLYWQSMHEATFVQWLFLVLTFSATFALLCYSCYLQKKVLFRKPWVPPQKVAAGAMKPPSSFSNEPESARGAATYNAGYGDADLRSEAGWFARVNSGIVLTRTDSYGESIGPLGLAAAAAAAGTPLDRSAVTPSTPYVPYGGTIPSRIGGARSASPAKQQPPGRYASSVGSKKTLDKSAESPPKGFRLPAFKGTMT